MKYYTLYENEEGQFADGYKNKKTALEYAEEAVSNGYKNVSVISDSEMKLLDYEEI